MSEGPRRAPSNARENLGVPEGLRWGAVDFVNDRPAMGTMQRFFLALFGDVEIARQNLESAVAALEHGEALPGMALDYAKRALARLERSDTV